MTAPKERSIQQEVQNYIRVLNKTQIDMDLLLDKNEMNVWKIDRMDYTYFQELYHMSEAFIELDAGLTYRRDLLMMLLRIMQDGARDLAHLSKKLNPSSYSNNRAYLERVSARISVVIVKLINHYDMTLITQIPPYNLVPIVKKLAHSKKNDPDRSEIFLAYPNLHVWREDSLYYHTGELLCFTKSGKKVTFLHMGTGNRLGHYHRELTLAQAKRQLWRIAARYDVDAFVTLLHRTDTVISPQLVWDFTTFVDDVEQVKSEHKGGK